MDIAKITQAVIAIAAAGALAVSVYNATQINNVHVIINSRFDQFIALTQKSSKAEGVKQEKDRQSAEDEKEGK